MNNTKRQQAIKRHIRRVDAGIHKLGARRERFAKYRPAIFFLGVALTYWFGWTPLILSIGLMGIEAGYYHGIGKIMRRHQLWLDIKTTQLARMMLDWEYIPEPLGQDRDEKHPFEVDLDITGRKSLQHLLDMTISHGGSQRLGEWLLHTRPDLETITTRQQIVRELACMSRFRDKLLLNFRLASQEQLQNEKLLHWLHIHPSAPHFQWAFPLSVALAALNIILLIGYFLGWVPGFWVFSLAIYLAIYFTSMPTLKKSFDALMLLYDELDKFKTILLYLETYPYGKNIHLKRVCEPFYRSEQLPSALLKKVTWLTTAVGLRMNPLLGLFLNLVAPWDLYFSRQIEQCQQQCAVQFPEWVETWSELEAYISLANFAYLYPEYVFPEFMSNISTAEHPILQAAALGHPLLPVSQKICNDFSLDHSGKIVLLTGSNMAGKSTFLKTIGINLCLAYTGGPVNATAFQTGLFRIFSCIQIHDSVTEGFSFFYAEVKRLKVILDALRAEDSLPVLFLIDEIFKGTNSRERLIGGRAYIQYIARQPGFGVIATHDLELGQLEQQIPGLRNMHFRDAVLEGKMAFDYILRPGLCPTTNALKIMYQEGLPVDM
ncbi:DNA mismatch repair protein MutS domain protein [Candidatus Vecturithrix granuli]|uniref:DNA mismatch repair protein MutS domain protein n=1 Tax=Vecturithrix granuli TaxID=1499967 RepID=A0A081C859_VECG1|nr:DNA mismatch repair protein MutS domain protein [Candidatus Vecturithrix granuli]